jgi:hypothetical protein
MLGPSLWWLQNGSNHYGESRCLVSSVYLIPKLRKWFNKMMGFFLGHQTCPFSDRSTLYRWWAWSWYSHYSGHTILYRMLLRVSKPPEAWPHLRWDDILWHYMFACPWKILKTNITAQKRPYMVMFRLHDDLEDGKVVFWRPVNPDPGFWTGSCWKKAHELVLHINSTLNVLGRPGPVPTFPFLDSALSLICEGRSTYCKFQNISDILSFNQVSEVKTSQNHT